jgi:hypothetical protein
VTGSKDDAVEAEPLEVGWSIVATDISVVCWERFDRSLALEMRVGTSDRAAEFIYAFVVEVARDGYGDAAMFQRQRTQDICLSDSACSRAPDCANLG